MAIPRGPAAVSLITAGGTDIPWRPNADPRAVLGITANQAQFPLPPGVPPGSRPQYPQSRGQTRWVAPDGTIYPGTPLQ
jgi:hypothetical protein